MDKMIQETIASYRSSLTIPADTDLEKEVESVFGEINKLGESCSDILDFTSKFSTSGLQEKYMNLFVKVSNLQATNVKDDASIDNGEVNSKSKLLTVKEFLEQYRSSYESVKAQEYRKRAEKAYENLFAVANRTNDLIEMNIILEKEKLLWKITSEDLLDLYEPILEAVDPLNEAFVNFYTNLKESASESLGDEELTYRLKKAEVSNEQFNQRFWQKIRFPLALINNILSYETGKLKFWITGSSEYLTSMAFSRHATKKTYQFMEKMLGMDFDSIRNDEWLKVWLLAPKQLDTWMRNRVVLDPDNLQILKTILFDEILSERTLENILLSEKDEMPYLYPDNINHIMEEYKQESEKRNANLVYYQYEKKISGRVKENKEIPANDKSMDTLKDLASTLNLKKSVI